MCVRRMDWVILLALTALGLSCGGGRGTVGAGGIEAAHPAVAPADVRGFALPAPGTMVALLGEKAAAGAVLTRMGSEFEPELVQRTEAASGLAVMQPVWENNASPFTTVAYAVYRFNIGTYVGPQMLELTWAGPALDHSRLWIGMSRWNPGRWDWYPGPADDVLDFGADGLMRYIKPGTEDLLVAVVLLGTSQAMLQHLRLGAGNIPDGWPMYGHDARHTFRSQYTGPQQGELQWTFRAAGPGGEMTA